MEPRIRRGTLRIAPDVAARLRAGHPLVFREALGARPLLQKAGDMIEVVDADGAFVARGLYDPEGVVALRVVTRDPNEIIDGTALRHRVEAAKRLRTALLDSDTDVYRVIHGEGDAVPGITVDRYGDYLVAHLYTPAAEPLRDWLYDALEAAYRPKAIYEQKRYKPLAGAENKDGPRGPATLARGQLAPVELEVQEGGLKFVVDVTAPLGTGLFPDLRDGRRAVGERARGRRVLNLFSYTGAFSLWAARGGATQVTSVDLAQKAHARARRNLALNGLPESAHELIAGDAFKVLAKMAERSVRFDLIVLDPPSFAQAKGRVFSVQKDYRELVEAVLNISAPDALIACVSNTHKMSWDELDRAIGEAAGKVGRFARIVERRGLPIDFPVPVGHADGNYL